MSKEREMANRILGGSVLEVAPCGAGCPALSDKAESSESSDDGSGGSAPRSGGSNGGNGGTSGSPSSGASRSIGSRKSGTTILVVGLAALLGGCGKDDNRAEPKLARHQEAVEIGRSLYAFAGNGTRNGSVNSAASALNVGMRNPGGVAIAPDGSVLIADTHANRIRKVATNGAYSTFYGANANSMNLILNPGYESNIATAGQIPDWVVVSPSPSTWGKISAGAACPTCPEPFDGNDYLTSNSATTAELRQDVSVSAFASAIDAGTQRFKFIGYVRSPGPTASATIIIQWLNSAKTSLATLMTNGPWSNATSWLRLSADAPAPVGTRFVRVRLVSNRSGTATHGGFFDGLSLVAVSGTNGLNKPQGLAFLGSDLLIADSNNHCVRRINPAGAAFAFAGTCGTAGTTATLLNSPTAVGVNAVNGDAFIADTLNHRIIRVRGGTMSVIAGNGSEGFAGDGGAATAARFRYPTGVAADGLGVVYVADRSNHRVRRIDTTGIITTMVGTGTPGLSGNGGSASAAQLFRPWAVSVNNSAAEGYVVEVGNHVVRKVKAGVINTLIGSGTRGSSGDSGLATLARLANPVAAVANPNNGDVFVVDQENHRVRVAGCSDRNVCTGAETYGPGTGICSSGTPIVWDDSNACTADSCDPSTGQVTHANVAPGTSCSNGNACDGAETCNTFGVCLPGTPVPTNDGNPCTQDVCNTSTGAVTHPAAPAGTPCPDTNLCNGAELCNASAACQPGTPIPTSDGNVCTRDVCNASTGVVTHPPEAAGTACSDGSVCTVDDKCNGSGACARGPALVGPDDDNPCTVQRCDAVTGIFHEPLEEGAECTWGCAGLGTCTASEVRPDGSRVDPRCIRDLLPEDDGDECTIEICDEATQEVSVVPCNEPDLTGITTVGLATDYLYEGDAPQSGVTPGTIETMQASAIAGRVHADDGEPLQSVKVEVEGRPEYGHTFSQLDGSYLLAVNGGDEVMLRFERAGFISARRLVPTVARQYARAEDLTMLQADPVATPVAFGVATGEAQVASGSVVADESGVRQAGVLVPSGTQAAVEIEDGSIVEADELTLRVTEYTVGDQGSSAMPATLPPNSAYTYAIELSVDEGGHVEFDREVFIYVEDFLGFPIGTPVPTGFVEKTSGRWVASQNGRVIRVANQVGGLATIEGADDLVIDNEERRKLAESYLGKTLWRVPIQHFSTWDCNWAFGPPAGAISPNGPDPVPAPRPDDPDECTGSIIEAQNRIVGQSVPLVGTGLSLNYRSDRVSGYGGHRTLRIPLHNGTLPSVVKRVDITVDVAGKSERFEHSRADALANPVMDFTWDGMDKDGNPIQGSTPVTVLTQFVYDGVYETPEEFAGPIGNGMIITGVPSRGEIMFDKYWTGALGGVSFEHFGFGGWMLSAHHFYDAENGMIYLGDGSRQSGQAIGAVMEPVVGNGEDGPYVHEPPSPSGSSFTYWAGASGVVPDSDGDIYFLHYHSGVQNLLRLDSKGRVTHLTQYFGEGPRSASAFAPGIEDDEFLLARSDFRVDRALRIDGSNLLPFAGNGVPGHTGDGGPAHEASINRPLSVALGPDGSVYIGSQHAPVPPAGRLSGVIRKVDPNGVITTIAGGGQIQLDEQSDPAEGQPAKSVALADVVSLAVDRNGDLYGVQRSQQNSPLVGRAGLFKIDRSGRFSTPVAFDGWELPPGVSVREGVPIGPVAVAVRDGRVVVLGHTWPPAGVEQTHWVGALVPGRRAVRLAGAVGQATFAPGQALSTVFQSSLGIAIAPTGAVYVQGNPIALDIESRRIWRIRSALPSLDGVVEQDPLNVIVPSPDGRDVYEFDYRGRHQRTADGLTGVTRRRFTYNAGLLANVIEHVRTGDASTEVQHTTQVTRTAGNVSVRSPFNQTTTIGVDANGFVQSIKNPNNETVLVAHDPDGLLTSFQTGAGRQSSYVYDGGGMLFEQLDPPIEPGTTGGITRYESVSSTMPMVRRTSSLGSTIHFAYQSNGLGNEERENDYADGSSATLERTSDGKSVAIARDGTRIDRVSQADPRLGIPAQFDGSTLVRLPSALLSVPSAAAQHTRTRRDSSTNPMDISMLANQTDTLCVNGTGTIDQCSNGFKATSALGLNATTRLGQRTTTTPALREIKEFFDPQSRLTSVNIPGTTPTTATYDSFGRIASMSQGGRSTLFGYSPTSGFLATITDANAKLTTFGNFDGAGRPRLITLPGGTATIGLTYDADARVQSVTPPGKGAHNFQYNGLGRVALYDPPIGPAVRHVYNKNRQLELITHDASPNPVLVADLLYDAATGQLVTVDTLAADLGLSYSPSTGQLTHLTSPEGAGLITLEQRFDGFLLSALGWSGQGRGSVAWTHNNRLLLATETVRGGSAGPTPVPTAQCAATQGCVAYNYDTDGITTSITSGQAPNQFTYTLQPNNATGRIDAKTIGVIREALTYNSFGELQQQEVKNTQSGVTLFKVVYDSSEPIATAAGKRDLLGRIVKKTETVESTTRVVEYGYSSVGRPWLETVKVNGVQVSQYGYDGNGNRTLVSLNHGYAGGGVVSLGGSDIVTDAEDRLTKYGTTTFTYDELGRVKQKTEGTAVTKYTWDSLGTLRKVELPDGRIIEYLIDAIGRRVGKKVNGNVERRWIYRDTLRPIAELDAAGNVVARYVYADGAGAEDEAIQTIMSRAGALAGAEVLDRLLGSGSRMVGRLTPEYVERGGRLFRLVTDHLGSVRLVVDARTGEIVVRRDYDEYGAILGPPAGDAVVPFGFGGGIFDADIGLVRFGAREYDPRIGRWLSKDPIAFRGGDSNLYAYSANDSVNKQDQDGQSLACHAVAHTVCHFVTVGGAHVGAFLACFLVSDIVCDFSPAEPGEPGKEVCGGFMNPRCNEDGLSPRQAEEIRCREDPQSCMCGGPGPIYE